MGAQPRTRPAGPGACRRRGQRHHRQRPLAPPVPGHRRRWRRLRRRRRRGHQGGRRSRRWQLRRVRRPGDSRPLDGRRLDRRRDHDVGPDVLPAAPSRPATERPRRRPRPRVVGRRHHQRRPTRSTPRCPPPKRHASQRRPPCRRARLPDRARSERRRQQQRPVHPDATRWRSSNSSTSEPMDRSGFRRLWSPSACGRGDGRHGPADPTVPWHHHSSRSESTVRRNRRDRPGGRLRTWRVPGQTVHDLLLRPSRLRQASGRHALTTGAVSPTSTRCKTLQRVPGVRPVRGRPVRADVPGGRRI